MQTIKALIVDDEQDNIDVLEALLQEYCPQVTIVAKVKNVSDAVKSIQAFSPELIFLDIELRQETGFALFEIFPDPNFQVIFTTAHEEYALKAIKSSCLEFILKPINYTELMDAVKKFEKHRNLSINSKKIETLLDNIGHAEQSLRKIAIPNEDGYTFINIQDIIYCEADLNYSVVLTNRNERILSTKNLKEFEDILNPAVFFRCHKSCLINLNCVKKYSRTDGTRVLMANDIWIDIAVRKREDFIRLFNRF